MSDIRVLRGLAEALGIAPHVLGLAGTTVLGTPPHRAVAAARSVFQRGRYTEVATVLPELVSAAMATRAELTTSEDVATAGGQLVELYILACSAASFMWWSLLRGGPARSAIVRG